MRISDSQSAASDLMTELGCSNLDGGASLTNMQKLELAKAALELALALTSEVAEDTEDGHADAYFVDHLAIMASDNHGFCSRDFNIDKWIEQLESDDDSDAE